jgi:hypothetical protein
MVLHGCRQHLASTPLRESRCEFPRRFRVCRECLPPQSVTSFALLRKSRNARMRATSVACTAPVFSLPIDLNNLCGCSFGTRIAYQHSKAQRSALLGRIYVTDSGIRSQVGWMVSPVAIPQGIQLRRLHSVRPVASAWLTGIHTMNTALSSNAIGPVTTNIDSDRLTSSIITTLVTAIWSET